MLISYENEAILARQSGEDFDYIVPDATIKIENPGAVLKDANPESQGLPRFRAEHGRARGVRQEGLPARHSNTPVGEVDGANDPAKPFPVSTEVVHDQRAWRLGCGERQVL